MIAISLTAISSVLALGHFQQARAQPQPAATPSRNSMSRTQSPANPGVNERSPLPHITAEYGSLPMSFEANAGQSQEQVKFLARGRSYSVFLTGQEALVVLKRTFPRSPTEASKLPPGSSDTAIHMHLIGSRTRTEPVGESELPGKTNYLIGNDPSKWRANVPTYKEVKYAGVYPGVDLIYYGNQGNLEYDFVVSPGVDPTSIRMRIGSADRVHGARNGDLLLGSDAGKVHLKKPVIYQIVNGSKQRVDGRYRLASGNVVGFQVGRYDRSRPLVIDPILDYSSYLGGEGDDFGAGISLDPAGNAYVVGYTTSNSFPLANPLQSRRNSVDVSLSDVFITKISANGTTLVYSTYLGGAGSDIGQGITVDSAGNAYVTGYTGSTDFPVVNALQPAPGGNYDVFVAKINPAGSALVYSTYLGGLGADEAFAIAADSAGRAYITGFTQSANFPTSHALQTASGGGGGDVFVTELDTNGASLIYSTYLGGNGYDQANGIALDASNNVYITGYTSSTNFPTVAPLQAALSSPSFHVFITKINPAGTALVFSTYLGGSSTEEGNAIFVDPAGSVYVTGFTQSSDFPTANPVQKTFGGATDAFLVKLSATGAALTYSTFLGGTGYDRAQGVTVDGAGNAYVVGWSESNDFPTLNSLHPTCFQCAFIAEYNAAGSSLIYSTFLSSNGPSQGQGIVGDSSGNVYATGFTSIPTFPTTNAFQTTYGGGPDDAFVVKLSPFVGSACDVNMDGTTNVADVQKEINEALGVTTATNDLNADSKVNVADVQIVINAALGLGCAAH